MKTITAIAANKLGKFIAKDFRRVFGPAHDDMAERLGSFARSTIECLARSDALYHNYEHTLQVTMVGRDILEGMSLSQRIEPTDYSHLIIACLLHDIGYILCARVHVSGRQCEGRLPHASIAVDKYLPPRRAERPVNRGQRPISSEQPLRCLNRIRWRQILRENPLQVFIGYATNCYLGLDSGPILPGCLPTRKPMFYECSSGPTAATVIAATISPAKVCEE